MARAEENPPLSTPPSETGPKVEENPVHSLRTQMSGLILLVVLSALGQCGASIFGYLQLKKDFDHMHEDVKSQATFLRTLNDRNQASSPPIQLHADRLVLQVPSLPGGEPSSSGSSAGEPSELALPPFCEDLFRDFREVLPVLPESFGSPDSSAIQPNNLF